MVHGEKHKAYSATPTGEGQYNSGLSVTTSLRQDRLDPESRCIPRDQHYLGATGSGSFCHMIFNTACKILQLESGSRRHSNRCLYPGVDSTSSICTHPMVPHLESANEGSPLAVSTMVPDATHHDSGCPTDSRPALPVTELRLPSARMPSISGHPEGIGGKENSSECFQAYHFLLEGQDQLRVVQWDSTF